MVKIHLTDIDQYEEESTVEKFKKRQSNPNKRHNKNVKHVDKEVHWEDIES